MATITKAILTITSSFAAAPAFSVFDETWGRITLWDIRPWLPWTSRLLVGVGNWQDYLFRDAAMDSTQAPDYAPIPEGPKSWAKQTNVVTIYDSTASHVGNWPYTASSAHGSGPYTYTPNSTSSGAAFDATTPQSLVATLVLAIFATNSFTPSFGGPTATDNLNFYGAYVDVTFDDASTMRIFPTVSVVEDPGVGVGSPTGVLNAAGALDADVNTTFATVQETNGTGTGGAGALWHPAVLLLTTWSWGIVECNNPPRGEINSPYDHVFTHTGDPGDYTFSITDGTFPPGLTLNSTTGEVTGMPTLNGNYFFTVTVTLEGVSASALCEIMIGCLLDRRNFAF